MSILNVPMGEGTDYTIHLRKPKGRGGMGGGGKKVSKEPLKRSKLRPVSPKQRKRTNALHDKLEVMIHIQETWGYNPHCQKCLAARFDGNEIKLFADHVGTRNQKNADRYENLGILCYSCNTAKGSVREEDYRPEWFKAEMVKLDFGQ